MLFLNRESTWIHCCSFHMFLTKYLSLCRYGWMRAGWKQPSRSALWYQRNFDSNILRSWWSRVTCLTLGHTSFCLSLQLSFENVLVWLEHREETHGKQVWLHQICQGGSLSLESFLQRAAGKLSKTILLWMQMNPFELHFRYVGVYGCQSPLRFWESCKHDTDSQSPSVWMLQHCGKIWFNSNMATYIVWWQWLTPRRPTLAYVIFLHPITILMQIGYYINKRVRL